MTDFQTVNSMLTAVLVLAYQVIYTDITAFVIHLASIVILLQYQIQILVLQILL